MSRLFAILTLLVGAGLFLTFGAFAVDSALDLQAFPERPGRWTLEELADLRRVPRGLWVTLRGPYEVEAAPVRPNAGGPSYVLLRDPARSAFLVVAGDALDSKRPWTGVPAVHAAAQAGSEYRKLPRGLQFPGFAWTSIPSGRIVILWTHAGPADSRTGVFLSPALALLGLFVGLTGLRNLRRPRPTLDVAWGEGDLPKAVRLGRKAGGQLRTYAAILLGFGLLWLGTFGALEVQRGRMGPQTWVLLSVGVVLVALGTALALQARRVSGHRYFADLLWLPVLRTFAVRSEGIATGVQAYELEMPRGAKQKALTVHSSALHGGLVFRDASRTEVLAARPLHSPHFIVLSSSLSEIEENPLAPLAHPRHRVRQLL
jgi:hypothetical protein